MDMKFSLRTGYSATIIEWKRGSRKTIRKGGCLSSDPPNQSSGPSRVLINEVLIDIADPTIHNVMVVIALLDVPPVLPMARLQEIMQMVGELVVLSDPLPEGQLRYHIGGLDLIGDAADIVLVHEVLDDEDHTDNLVANPADGPQLLPPHAVVDDPIKIDRLPIQDAPLVRGVKLILRTNTMHNVANLTIPCQPGPVRPEHWITAATQAEESQLALVRKSPHRCRVCGLIGLGYAYVIVPDNAVWTQSVATIIGDDAVGATSLVLTAGIVAVVGFGHFIPP